VVTSEVGELHEEYEQIAHKILVNNDFKPSSEPVLSEEEIMNTIHAYLEKIGLENYVEV
jgi:hypothetical protein